MGITGLFKHLEKATRKVSFPAGNISEYKGKRVAIDMSCFLHKAMYGCTEDLAKMAPILSAPRVIKYLERQLAVYLHYKCAITLVFDGQSLPAKEVSGRGSEEQLNDRDFFRTSTKPAGSSGTTTSGWPRDLLAKGKDNEAFKVMRQGIGVPKEVSRAVIRHFKQQQGYQVIVAPWPSSLRNNLVDVVVTEDSDLIVFECPTLCFKAESTGDCMVYEQSKLTKCFPKGFTFTKFRRMCILSGCDYLEGGIAGIGLKKAEKFFVTSSLEDHEMRIILYCSVKDVVVTEPLVEAFKRAENTFLHQIVYDPVRKCQLPLTPYPGTTHDDYLQITQEILDKAAEFDFAGVIADPKEAQRAARGGDDVLVFVNKAPLSQSSVQNTSGGSPATGFFAPPSRPAFRPTTQWTSTQPTAKKENVRPSLSASAISHSAPTTPAIQAQKRPYRPSGMYNPIKTRRVSLDDNNGIVFNATSAEEKRFIEQVKSIKNGALLQHGNPGAKKVTQLHFSTVVIESPPPVNFPAIDVSKCLRK
ncbi:XPG N-terminal and XPG I domain containing protein [Aphelenchoides fujianensis]|nr:XPG N-terminal and XPG I domain containing protein [Aphelenchoides fujianensis]